MSLLSILYHILIGPLVLIFEVIYSIVYQTIRDPGVSIFVLSMVVNILVLPLYRRADAMQAEQREIENKLQPGIAHIRKTFRGDERFMMLQTYYRQNHYKPTSSLKGSLSLLLEIPFFIAAYRFLSGLALLNGASLGPIRELGAPDGLLTVAGISVNVLPVLMTLINIVSGAVYTKGYPLKSKLQLYGMAAVFLVLLYQSPAGLVFYWTLNNLFSLGKNIVMELAKRRKERSETRKKAQAEEAAPKQAAVSGTIARTTGRVFLTGCVFLTVFTGLFLPMRVIGSSPEEFVDLLHFQDPLVYVLFACCTAAGLFLVWFGIFYKIAGEKGKRIMAALVWIAACGAAADALLFSRDLGTMSSLLIYDEVPLFGMRIRLLNALVILAVAAVCLFVLKKKAAVAAGILAVASVAFLGSSVISMAAVRRTTGDLEKKAEAVGGRPEFVLSREKKNVIVFMLDRGINSFVPYLMQEKPELREQFAGFTWYPNTISFGSNTKLGSPGIFGGYDYTPREMNRRKDETLEEKQNAALKLMPRLFSENGYKVTVCDPPYAGYTWVPSVDIYDDIPGVNAYVVESAGVFNEDADDAFTDQDAVRKRNLFCWSVFRAAPVLLQGRLYNNGYYNDVDRVVADWNREAPPGWQTVDSMTTASGRNYAFMNGYNELCALPEITAAEENAPGAFIMIDNEIAHEQTLLQEPAYEPALQVDNTAYDAAHADRFTCDGRTIAVTTKEQMMTYQINMAAFLKLGDWFDHMRELGVYDNTRIILVSDHGWGLHVSDDWNVQGIFENGDDTSVYQALMLVKDFGDTEFRQSDGFMTNADTPTLAMEGLIDSPVDPATGKAVTNAAKTEGDQMISTSRDWEAKRDGATQFTPAEWYAVHDNALDMANWSVVEDPEPLNSGG